MVDQFLDSLLQQDLRALRTFLHQAARMSSREGRRLVRAGGKPTYEDVELPFLWMQIALRAIYHELSAIVEHEMQVVTFEFWEENKIARIRRNEHLVAELRRALKEGRDTPEAVHRILSREVEDERFTNLVRLLEERYDIIVMDLPGASKVFEAHQIANDLKHRKGRVDSRKVKRGDPEWHDLNVGDAIGAVEAAGRFVKSLRRLRENSRDSIVPTA